jgi:putative AdoMet-dependent methyltransferase
VGREFLDVFESWASSYDDTVLGVDVEYFEVFRNYQSILEQVSLLSQGHVLEFGAGTGNLTEKLLKRGLTVTAIEPSQAMRKIFQTKLLGNPNVVILDGDFLDFPVPNCLDTIVSTYAFHHLTDEEKAEAISMYRKLLRRGGKIVFADTMYPSKSKYHQAIENAKAAKFLALAKDLQTEYYTTIPFLQEVVKANDFHATFRQCNHFVWIMEAVKRK